MEMYVTINSFAYILTLCCITRDSFYEFVERTDQGTLGENANRRDTAKLPVVCADGLDSLSRERRNRERARTEKKREGRVWYALRAAGSHTTGPKERTPGPRRRFLHHARPVEPPVNVPVNGNAKTLQSEEASPK